MLALIYLDSFLSYMYMYALIANETRIGRNLRNVRIYSLKVLQTYWHTLLILFIFFFISKFVSKVYISSQIHNHEKYSLRDEYRTILMHNRTLKCSGVELW